MIRSNGGWYDFNWNPAIGCRHDCNYCYLPKYMERFTGQKTLDPTFYPEVLDEPKRIKQKKIIFVCAYADLFGSWVPAHWIEKVLQVIRETPQHTYVFLTKNPRRYAEFEYPDNVYCGVTIEDRDRMFRADELASLTVKKFCSIEPILGDFTGVDLSMFDCVVVGLMLNKKITKRDRENMKSVIHRNKYEIIR